MVTSAERAEAESGNPTRRRANRIWGQGTAAGTRCVRLFGVSFFGQAPSHEAREPHRRSPLIGKASVCSVCSSTAAACEYVANAGPGQAAKINTINTTRINVRPRRVDDVSHDVSVDLRPCCPVHGPARTGFREAAAAAASNRMQHTAGKCAAKRESPRNVTCREKTLNAG